MKFEAATIKDIAKALGLSTSTVSRALRDSYEISAETKEAVLGYAKKIKYHPNPIALSMREKRHRSIGVIVAEIANGQLQKVVNSKGEISLTCPVEADFSHKLVKINSYTEVANYIVQPVYDEDSILM